MRRRKYFLNYLESYFLNTHPNELHVNPYGYSSWENDSLGEQLESSLSQTKGSLMNFAPSSSTIDSPWSLSFVLSSLTFSRSQASKAQVPAACLGGRLSASHPPAWGPAFNGAQGAGDSLHLLPEQSQGVLAFPLPREHSGICFLLPGPVRFLRGNPWKWNYWGNMHTLQAFATPCQLLSDKAYGVHSLCLSCLSAP